MDKLPPFLDGFARKLDTAGIGVWREWLPIAAVVLLWLMLIVMLLVMLKSINFRVGSKYFMVTLLGVPIRWIRIDNIRTIHTRRVRFAERWHNVILPHPDRALVIEKRRGLIKQLLITPEQRYVFKAELDRAIRAYLGLKAASSAADTTTFDRMQAPAGDEAVPAAAAAEQSSSAQQGSVKG
jgi:hypothetical protein